MPGAGRAPSARATASKATVPTAKEIRAALTAEPTPRARSALVGAWRAMKQPLTKAPRRAPRSSGFNGSALELAGQEPDVRIELRLLGDQLLDLLDGRDH